MHGGAQANKRSNNNTFTMINFPLTSPAIYESYKPDRITLGNQTTTTTMSKYSKRKGMNRNDREVEK